MATALFGTNFDHYLGQVMARLEEKKLVLTSFDQVGELEAFFTAWDAEKDADTVKKIGDTDLVTDGESTANVKEEETSLQNTTQVD